MTEAQQSARREQLGLLVLLAVAAAVRFVDLPTRGTWDADQGHDLLVLRAFVQDGVVPLLGPPTSIGAFHHGVLYYWLLAPIAFVSGSDPLAIVAAIAVAGVAAVGVVWWLARAVAGPAAGFAAAGLMAVSASAIEESTFVWNPNLIALSSAIALAAAWRGWTTGRARWWIVVAAAQAVTMHLHVLGAVLLLPLAAFLLLDARRRAAQAGRRQVLLAGAAGLLLIALTYVPLLVHEFQSGFAETNALIEYVATDSDAGDASLPVRLAVVWLRVLSWPLTGLVTAQPVAAILAALAILATLAWRIRAREPEGRAVAASLVVVAWSATAIALISSSLARVVPGLPNDHYHAFLDPVVFVVAGLGIAALWRQGNPGRVAAAMVVAAVVALNVTLWPPRVAPDGGYPEAERAAARILQTIGGDRYVLDGLPTTKSADAYGFPLVRLGGEPAPSNNDFAPNHLVIACDRLLEPMIGASCGGPAEDARAAELGEGQGGLVERFDASPRTVISIYR